MIQVLFILLAPALALANDECGYFRERMKAELGLSSCRLALLRFLDIEKEHFRGLEGFRAEVETSFRAFSPKEGLPVADAVTSGKATLGWAADALKGAPAFMEAQNASIASFLADIESDLEKIRARDRDLRQPRLKGDVNGLPKEAEAVARAVMAENKSIDDQRARDRQSLMTMNDDHQDTIRMAKQKQERWKSQHECFHTAIAYLKKRQQELGAAKLASVKEVEAFVKASRPMTAPRATCE